MKKSRPRKKQRGAERMSSRLLTVLVSVLASALLMVGLAIYAENQPIHPLENITPALESTESPTEQPTPTLGPTPEPTPEPSPMPTPEPTPLPSAYTLSIIPPSGWHREKANVLIHVIDENNTGWQSVTAQINANGPWYDLTHRFGGTDYTDIEISDNCTIFLTVTGLDGVQHTINQPIQCMDRELPAVRAAINGDMLRATAKDGLSGVAAITVCNQRFTDLADGLLLIRIQDHLGNFEFLVIQAEDNVGNKSNIITLQNPFYDARRPTPSPTPTPAPTPKPTSTPAPKSTPAPTKKPSGSSGSSTSNSQGTASAIHTPVPSETPEPEILLPWDDEPEDEPENTPEPTLEPTSEPAPEAAPTIQPGTGFTTTGNAVARDLLYDQHTNKQFIRVEAREGSSYFLIIDYDKPLDEAGDSYETYFLNMVDSRDLFDVVNEDDIPARFINPTAAPTAVPIPTPQPTAVPPEPTQEPAPPPAQSGGGGIALVFLLLAGGGGALWYFKFRKPQEQGKKKGGYDDFEWGDDENEEDDEPEESDGDDP